MRKVNNIVIHCTATAQNARLESIQNYWKNNLGWKSPGYHRLISADGTVHKLSEFEKPTNGVAGHNSDSIHISYIGGIDEKGNPKDTRTPEQKRAIINCIHEARRIYPEAKIKGHRDFPGVAKACPSFNAMTEYRNL
jgi:N-acetylmuramoyl-L-alanine amidase